MANETDGRRALVRVLKHDLGCHAHAVESGDVTPGIPDIEYCGALLGQGWLEVKRLPAWPKRPTTLVRLPKGYLKRAQVGFMKRRHRVGGTAGLAIQIQGRDWFLVGVDTVLELYDRTSEAIAFDQTWLREQAVRLSGPRGLNADQVFHALTLLRQGDC